MSLNDVLENYAKFAPRIDKILAPLLADYGIDNFFYTELYPQKNKAFFLSNQFEKVEKLVEIGKFSCDHNSYLNDLCHKSYQKFIWPMNPSDEIGGMLKSTGISSGMSLLFRVGDSIRNVGFASSQRNDSLLNTYCNGDELFHHFIKYFECEAESLILRREEALVDFLVREETEEERLDNEKMIRCLKSMDIKRFIIDIPGMNKHAYLTKREYACVYLLCKGLSTKQIAYNLNLSTRTVESYLLNSKTKLSVNSKYQLIDTALQAGIDNVVLTDR